MNTKKEKLLNNTYHKWLQTGLYDLPLDGANDFVDPKIMGYGTAIDEKVLSISEYRQLINRQREQAVGIEMVPEITPVFRSISNKEDAAIFVDEIKVKMIIDSEKHELFLRITTLLEYIDSNWIVVHWHGSIPTETTAEADAWLVNEWKRKNAELEKLVNEKTVELVNKNRELEIEASLERVRAVAMRMSKSEDLLSICEVTFKEFKKLGFDNLRNAVIHKLNDEKRFFVDYDYSDYLGGSIININYNSHPVVENYLAQIKKAEDAFAEVIVEGKELDSWKDFRRSGGQLDDPRLDGIPALYYYLYSIGFGDIGISTFSPIEESQIKVLKRFRNVFDLAYRRYNDIAFAEAQAREAQIEAALERVRSRSMAMHKSEELSETAEVLFEQINLLGKIPDRMSIGIINEESKNVGLWVTDQGGNQLSHEFFFSLDEPTSIVKIYNAWKERKDSFVVDLTGQKLQDWLLFVKENAKLPIDETKIIGRRVQQAAFFSQGFLLLTTHEPVADEIMKLLVRFAKVFDQTYRRFLDLQKAEAQAREAQIELALERVRARTMSMQKSDELREAVLVIYEQLQQLNFEAQACNIIIIDNDTGDMQFWVSGFSQEIYPESYHIPRLNHHYHEDQLKGWRDGVKYAVFEYSGKEKKRFDKMFFTKTDFKKVPEQAKQFMMGLESVKLSTAFFSYGSLQVLGQKAISEEKAKILQRFAKVFDQTYTRFLDLQKAEAQAREAMIEAALEKVRSRTMAMHRGDELADTSKLLFEQLLKLGIKPRTCGFLIMDDESESMEDWSSHIDEHDKVILVIGRIAYYQHPLITRVVESWRRGDHYFIGELHGEELQKYYHAVTSKETSSRGINDQVLVNTISEYTNSFYFNYGMMYVLTPTPLSEFETEVMLRFAGVFKSTYTRFLDLKKAETQARESQIEVALERVRSKTMAMQRSDELAETSAEVFKQLINLGIEPNRIYIAIIKDEKGIVEFWITDEDGSKVSTGFTANLNDNISFKKMYDGWREQKKSITIDMQGKELEEYFKHLSQLNVPFKGGLSQKRRIQNIAYFSKGFIGIASPDLLPEETIDLLKRFAAVFNLTYTRFSDLQQAEAQNKIIQAENNRKTKELEDARQLQLSMLPKEIPKLPHLDIAVYMKTATEVGGDYYDFYVQPDGALTILVGDATGHGMMSGMMVSIMKSFFISNRMNIELKHFFENSNSSIKDMHLGRLMMPLMGVQITSKKVIATNAGMPSLIYFRNKSQKAGEFVNHNMPLGAMKGTKYLLKEINYEKGDTLLLMSDGFAELKNENNEQYGYPRIIEEFKSVARKDPNEIVEYLEYSASKWINGVEPDDDVTIVVIKVK